MVGIYKITNPNGKVYIGQSTDIDSRFVRYKKLDCKTQPKIYRSLKKYGIQNHTFDIIEECESKYLNVKERHWQEAYEVLGPKGLNCVLTKSEDRSGVVGLSTRLSMKSSAQRRDKTHMISLGKRNKEGALNPNFGNRGDLNPLSKKVLQIDPVSGAIVGTYGSIEEASRCTGIDRANISRCCNKVKRYKTAKGYRWEFGNL